MLRLGPCDIENADAGLIPGPFSLRVSPQLPIEKPLCNATWTGLSKTFIHPKHLIDAGKRQEARIKLRATAPCSQSLESA
jgi:hypothetical protein